MEEAPHAGSFGAGAYAVACGDGVDLIGFGRGFQAWDCACTVLFQGKRS